jgi:hypothetical protein
VSLAQSRAAVVTALASLPELSATPTVPQTITTYSAWPVLARAEPLNWCIDQATWFVFVALPAGNSATTVAAGDQTVDDLLPALKPVGKVTAVEPWSWPVEPGQAAVPVIRFTLEA